MEHIILERVNNVIMEQIIWENIFQQRILPNVYHKQLQWMEENVHILNCQPMVLTGIQIRYVCRFD